MPRTRRIALLLGPIVAASILVAGVQHPVAASGAHQISVASPQQFSESVGTANVQVTVSPPTDADETLTVDFVTVNGSAVAGQDYTQTTGTLPIGPNTATSVIAVPITNDNGVEATEDFFIDLTAPTCTETTPSVPECSATVADQNETGTGDATVVIMDDDGPARTATVNDASTTEGNSATFTVTLSHACLAGTATIPFDTTSFTSGQPSGTAAQGTDYPRTQGSVVFETGVTTRTFTVNTIEDVTDEPNETFAVFLGSPTGSCTVALGDGQGEGTIVDDDPGPAPGGSVIAIGDRQVNERNTGTRLCKVRVRLSPASTSPVSVHWKTADGTATAGEDYIAGEGVVTFAPGVIELKIATTVIGDTRDEPRRRERYFINLDDPTGGATISDDQGRCVIYEGKGG
jgi:chitinase